MRWCVQVQREYLDTQIRGLSNSHIIQPGIKRQKVPLLPAHGRIKEIAVPVQVMAAAALLAASRRLCWRADPVWTTAAVLQLPVCMCVLHERVHLALGVVLVLTLIDCCPDVPWLLL